MSVYFKQVNMNVNQSVTVCAGWTHPLEGASADERAV